MFGRISGRRRKVIVECLLVDYHNKLLSDIKQKVDWYSNLMIDGWCVVTKLLIVSIISKVDYQYNELQSVQNTFSVDFVAFSVNLY